MDLDGRAVSETFIAERNKVRIQGFGDAEDDAGKVRVVEADALRRLDGEVGRPDLETGAGNAAEPVPGQLHGLCKRVLLEGRRDVDGPVFFQETLPERQEIRPVQQVVCPLSAVSRPEQFRTPGFSDPGPDQSEQSRIFLDMHVAHGE